MRLLLIRHGETVDNVARVYAGVTDSALTNHGVLQASRLGAHLSATGLKVDHIFSSDLQRAVQTAEAIRAAQSPTPPGTTMLEILREQDFGFYEGKKTFERPRDGSGKSGREAHADAHRNDPGFQDFESKASMRMRMDKFVDGYLLDSKVQLDHTVVIVAHGIILIYLWRVILKRLKPENITVAQGIQLPERGSSPSWSNTGYMDLEIAPTNNFSLNQFCPSPQPAPNVAEEAQGNTLDAGRSLPALEVLLPQSTAAASDKPPINSVGVAEGKLAQPFKFLNMSLVVKALNNREHLNGLKKSGGGLGSLKHDSSQKTLDSFFKKRRLE